MQEDPFLPLPLHSVVPGTACGHPAPAVLDCLVISPSARLPESLQYGVREALGCPLAPQPPEADQQTNHRTHNKNFIDAVAKVPLVGDRHVQFRREEVALEDIIRGMELEQKQFLGRRPFTAFGEAGGS